ncbi:peptidase inhibitor family I36 protein [Nocardiopsis suaedae]|uniref:Peptidase inhibitor family I36 protein n=1 Tax=Nocardiopsis suaedae TaxID=3018444 RepID=A0ABT4TH27_9ACTN|nr:peptidase inhibitor family I36 protein [Nocardiopsis suaedae]MDA2804018.1 peptidase inhibitor family I36 protein [Nocardiopsis suaedae]
MLKKIAIVASVGLLGFSGMVGTAAAADFHVYEHDDFNGRNQEFNGSDRNLANNYFDGGGAMNDHISSMKNHADHGISMYQHGGSSCGGITYYARADSEDRDLTNNDFDNRASCIIFHG